MNGIFIVSRDTLTSQGIGKLFNVGDKISFKGKPVRYRDIVSKIMGNDCFEFECFRRPSRGFAKHIRRMKSK